jgi:hypothetical protein
MSRIGIVGAGQSGLQLGIGLRKAGYDVVMLSNQTSAQIRDGRVTSSQCMFGGALGHERALGINFWDDECPRIDEVEFTIAGAAPGKALAWVAKLDAPAMSVDQRVKMPRWLEEFVRLGGELRVQSAGVDELEQLARECDLVVVAAGKGDVATLFERDAARSVFTQPMRALGLTYVTGLQPRPQCSAICFNVVPGVGEYFVFPALTTTGPCEIMVFEGVVGGPMDCWAEAHTPEQHLAVSREILRRHVPWEYERTQHVELTDANGILSGRFTPVVRRPVGRLPSGRGILGMADVVCLNDPITGQGSNNAAKCAAAYLESIIEVGAGPFDAQWMASTFESYWEYARHVTEWTNTMLLPPPPHVLALLGAGAAQPRIAHWFANAFDDPRRYFPQLADPAAAHAFIAAAG